MAVTDPKQAAAAAIAQAQASLEAAVEELDKLPALDARSIALAAHAMNNFITISGGVVELLIPALRDHPDPQVGSWLEGLQHTTDLMAHTVGQLMGNSVGVARRVQPEELHLARLAQRVCAYYRRYARPKGVEIVVTVQDDIPLLLTDRVLAAAILDNLLSNAVKYSPRERRIRVRVHGERDGAVCAVTDDGPGLSAADQARLYQPGVRLGATPTGGEPTNGYGLAIAKRFADQLGGELRCVSAPGQGATFSLWLPAAGPGA
jgi:two-component system, sensor histidine kinase and response regulator